MAEHRRRDPAHGLERPGRAAEGLERRQRLPVAKPDRLLLDGLAHGDAAAPQAALEEVDVRAREARVGRAEEGEELAPSALLPLEAQQREERLTVGGLAEPDAALDGERDPERPEHRLERSPPTLDRGHDEGDLVERDAVGGELPDRLRDELERPAGAGALEEADDAVERRPLRRSVGEEVTLEVRQRGVAVLAGAGRKLLDPARGERGEILLRLPQRGEGRSAGLVRHRHGHLGAGRERLEQAPLGAGEVLEAVREDRPPVPGVEVGAQPLDRTAAKQVAVPEPEPVELLAVGGVEERQVAVELLRVEQPRLELAEDCEQRVREAGEPRRAAEAVQRGARENAPRDERALCVARDRPRVGSAQGEFTEDVVEGADRACEQRAGPLQEVALDPLDVRPVRHDENRVAVDRLEVALEETSDLAGLRRPHDESQAHRPIVVAGPDGFPRPKSAKSGKCRRLARWTSST